jgi:four helix bundle protein
MYNSKKSVVEAKSYSFALDVVSVYKALLYTHKEYILSKQLLRSGTSIGANICEAEHAQSKKDFIAKMSIALKECFETIYWIQLLSESKYLTRDQFALLNTTVTDISRILTAIIKSSRKSL